METRDLTLALVELFESLWTIAQLLYVYLCIYFDFLSEFLTCSYRKPSFDNMVYTFECFELYYLRCIFYLTARSFLLLFMFSDLKATAPFLAFVLPVSVLQYHVVRCTSKLLNNLCWIWEHIFPFTLVSHVSPFHAFSHIEPIAAVLLI